MLLLGVSEHEMKTGIILLVVKLLVSVNDNHRFFCDAKPTASRLRACSEGHFYNGYFHMCMSCSVACSISEEKCRDRDCLDYMKKQCKPEGYYVGSIGRCRPCTILCEVSYKDCMRVGCIKNEPKISVIDVSRTHNKVTISWKQVIGIYPVIKVRYCQTGTEYCRTHTVPNPMDDTYATLYVDQYKTYYYYLVILEDSDEVVYMSDRLVVNDGSDKLGANTNMAAVYVGGSLIGVVVILTALGVILAFVPRKRRRVRYRKKLSHRPANVIKDANATEIALKAIGNRPKPSHANIGKDNSVNNTPFQSKRTPKQNPAQARVKPHPVPANRFFFEDEPARSDDGDVVIPYDYVNTMCHQNEDSSRNTVPACQTSQVTRHQVVSAQIHASGLQANQSNAAFPCEAMQDLGQIVSSEIQMEQEPEGTYNDTRIVVTQQPTLSTIGGGLRKATWPQDTLHVGQYNASACQANRKDSADAAATYEDMQELGQDVSSERHVEQNSDDSYDDVMIATQRQLRRSTTERCLHPPTWQHDALYQNNLNVGKANQNGTVKASSYENIPELGNDVSRERQRQQELEGAYNDVMPVIQRHVRQSASGGVLGQATSPKVEEHEGTYNDVRIVTYGEPVQSTADSSLGHARLVKQLSQFHSNDDVATGQSRYERLQPMHQHEYLDFRGLDRDGDS